MVSLNINRMLFSISDGQESDSASSLRKLFSTLLFQPVPEPIDSAMSLFFFPVQPISYPAVFYNWFTLDTFSPLYHLE